MGGPADAKGERRSARSCHNQRLPVGPRQETQPELEEATAQSRAQRSVHELLELETDNALQHARKFAEQASGRGKTVSTRQLMKQMSREDEQDQDTNVMRRPRSSQYERQRAREEKLWARRLTREQGSHWLESGRVRVPKRDPSQQYEEEVSRDAAGPGLEGGRPTTSQQSEPGDALGRTCDARTTLSRHCRRRIPSRHH